MNADGSDEVWSKALRLWCRSRSGDQTRHHLRSL